jgi:hypothetical protein
MGWVFVILGLVLGAIATFMVYYGQDLLRSPKAEPPRIERRALMPVQERLLEVLAKYQKAFAASKLVVSRTNGRLYFDGDRNKGKDTNLLTDLYGSAEGDVSRAGEFEKLMESMPAEYLRLYGEARLDNPFVVSVTEDGMKYLRSD